MMSTDPMTGDLRAIGTDLARAIRADHQRRTRRRRVARTAAIAAVSLVAVSGTAVAAGQLAGVIDLGGAVTAQPVSGIPAPPRGTPDLPNGVKGPSRLPYNYEIHGLTVNGKPFTGKVYLGSSRPLSSGDVCIRVHAGPPGPAPVAGHFRTGTHRQEQRVQTSGGGFSPVAAPGAGVGTVAVAASGSGPPATSVSVSGLGKPSAGGSCGK